MEPSSQKKTFLDQLRSKPPRTKRTYSLVASAAITLIIFTVWVFSVPSVFDGQGLTGDQSGSGPTVSPIASVSAGISQIAAELHAGFSGIMDRLPTAQGTSSSQTGLENGTN